MEIGINECVDTAVTDRFDELRNDMDNGFRDLRSRVQEMDTDELRREMSLLMMIGSTQMDAVRRLRRDVEEMDRDLHRLHVERSQFERASRELVDVMRIPFDPDDFSPAKLVRMAASVARERRCEPVTTSIESLGVTDLDRKESMTEIAMATIMGVFVLCVVVWTVMMVVKWA